MSSKEDREMVLADAAEARSAILISRLEWFDLLAISRQLCCVFCRKLSFESFAKVFADSLDVRS